MIRDQLPEPVQEYPIVVPYSVQWGDQDAFGHVNNTLYLRWFETSRMEYCRRIGMSSVKGGVGPILVSVDCQFSEQVSFPDELYLTARVERIGRSSIIVEHIVWSESASAVAASGKSVLVAYNYDEQQSVPVSDELRSGIESLEGRSL